VWQGGEGEGSLSFQCHLPAPWRGGGFGGGSGAASGAPSGLGYGFGASGGGGGAGGAGSSLAGEESVGASAARHLSSQSNRIGTRRAGTAAGRQKRCGGGGWKEDSSSSAATGSWRGGGGGGGGDGVGAVDESISRRVAAHAGLSRMGLGGVGGGDGSGDRVSYGRVYSRYGASGGADAHQDHDGGEGDGGSDGDGDAGDSPGHGGTAGGDAPSGDGSGSYARSRGGGGGVANTCVAYYPPSRQILVARMDKTVHMFQSTASAPSGSSSTPMLRRGLGRSRGRGWGGAAFLQVDRTEVVDTPQCMGVHVPLSSPASFQSGSGALSSGGGANANGDLLIVGDTSGRCSAYALPVMRDFGSGGGGSDKSGSITQGGFSYAYSSPGGVGVPASAGAGASSILGLGPSSAGAGTFASGGSAGASGRPHLFQIHRPGESIRRIAMLPTVGLLSAGMDGLLAISDLEAGKVVRELKGHKRGVYSFAHCEEHRCIFSAGFDSRVLVFDPYLPTPTGSLGASHGRVVDVLVNERKNQVVTVCADKKVKVFDIRTWGCIQSLADSQDYAPRDELTAAAFDSPSQCLVTAGNKVRLWPVVMAPGNKSRRGGPAHNNLVVAICYSAVFEQVISVSVDEAVHVWDVYTGQSVFEFRTSHSSPLTAACLDHRGKRLLTGAHDGSVLMWNFHNGARMHEFQSRKKELLALLYLPRTLQCVVGIGLERSVVRWPDPNAPKVGFELRSPLTCPPACLHTTLQCNPGWRIFSEAKGNEAKMIFARATCLTVTLRVCACHCFAVASSCIRTPNGSYRATTARRC
jgi:WD40 repeat protein